MARNGHEETSDGIHDEATTPSLEEFGSQVTRNYLKAAQSIPHTIGLRVTCVRPKAANGTIQGVSGRNFLSNGTV